MSILAFDIGGTAVKYGCFGKDEIFGVFQVKDEFGREALPEKLVEFVEKYSAGHIGICAPGPFDYNTGTGLMEHKLASLYNVSLREKLEKAFPEVEIMFVHDATAFIMGEICQNPLLGQKKLCSVMIGTGLGYAYCNNGKIAVNEKETPLKPMWNKAYKKGIAEDYVSATAIIRKAQKLGYGFTNVFDIANAAKDGDLKLKELFWEVGQDLASLINLKHSEEGFDCMVLGGQVSLSWDLMKEGFEKGCDIPYYISKDPAKSALYGIKYCIEVGKENVYIKGGTL